MLDIWSLISHLQDKPYKSSLGKKPIFIKVETV